MLTTVTSSDQTAFAQTSQVPQIGHTSQIGRDWKGIQ